MMGTIKTKIHKASSNALQKVAGNLKLKRQQLHDYRELQTTTVKPQNQLEPELEPDPQPEAEPEIAEAAVGNMLLQPPPPPPPPPPLSPSPSSKHHPADSADPRVLPDCNLNYTFSPPFITPQGLPSEQQHQPPPSKTQQQQHHHQPHPLSPVSAAATPSWASYEAGSPSSPPSSSSQGSAMSLEYTLAPAPDPMLQLQAQALGGTIIDLTKLSPPPYYGTSPANPIDLTGTGPTTATAIPLQATPPAAATLSVIKQESLGPVHGPPLANMGDPMLIDDFYPASDLENDVCNEGELLDCHIRQMEFDQMRKDEAIARELQSQLDQAPTFPATRARVAGFSGIGSTPLLPDDQDEDALRDYGKAILELRCAKCKVPIVEEAKDVIVQTLAHVETGTMRSCLACPSCEAAICLSCSTLRRGKNLPDNGLIHATSPMERASAAICCATDRVSMIWLLSCGHQVPASSSQPSSSTTTSRTRSFRDSFKRGTGAGGAGGGSGSSSSEAKKAISEPVKPVKPVSMLGAIANATASGKSAYNKGVGYGGEDIYPANHPGVFRGSSSKLPPAAPFKQQQQMDTESETLAAYFRTLTLVLPSLERSRPFDVVPDHRIARFIRRSPLLPKAAELLRNDSIDDMLAKEELYRAVLNFVRALAGHLLTARLVHSGLVMYPIEGQTFALSTSPSVSNGKGKTKAPEKTSSLASIVSRLGNICRRITQRAAAHQDEFNSDDGPRMISLCHSIVALDDFLTANKLEEEPVEVTSTRATRSQGAIEMAEKKAREHRTWHQQNCLADVLDDKLWENYYFKATAARLLNSQRGRMKRLITETTNLANSLPEGIFVRHASSRLDTMKVLIAGPSGTPYENGLFEFDLFCPESYPYVPPSMQFRTTGGGSVRFNPNLYEDGKGTWQGPSWNPSSSTILQVLVSIQSMVFCDKPWYNEPGRERQPNENASDSYNRGIQEWTVQHAMLKWLTGASYPPPPPPVRPSLGAHVLFPGSVPGFALPQAAGSTSTSTSTSNSDEYIWGDVVREHFKANSKIIGETLKKWKSKGLKGGKISTLATELNTAMVAKGYLA